MTAGVLSVLSHRRDIAGIRPMQLIPPAAFDVDRRRSGLTSPCHRQ
jgi:hypothetical protein